MGSDKPIKILIIEDNKKIFKYIIDLLKKEKVLVGEFKTVSSLAKANTYIKQHNSIDIILLDLSIADMSHNDSLSKFYSLSKDLPLVFLTDSNKDLALTAIQIGAQDYLFKGTFDAQMLQRTIYYAMERKKIELNLEQRKDDFMSATSHELKTPLTSQKAFIQVLDHMVTQNNDQKYKRYIKKIAIQNEKLSQIVNSLLDANKIKEGRLLYTPTEFDINVLLEEIITDLKQTTNRTVTVASDVKTHIKTDKAKIDQVISNLISNAVKYSPISSDILITLKEKKNSIIVSIQDYGIGIDIVNFEHIFEPFYRISGHRERTFPGLGMGLYISNEIIKHLGGNMWVESTKGKGSTFYFSIPLS